MELRLAENEVAVLRKALVKLKDFLDFDLDMDVCHEELIENEIKTADAILIKLSNQ